MTGAPFTVIAWVWSVDVVGLERGGAGAVVLRVDHDGPRAGLVEARLSRNAVSVQVLVEASCEASGRTRETSNAGHPGKVALVTSAATFWPVVPEKWKLASWPGAVTLTSTGVLSSVIRPIWSCALNACKVAVPVRGALRIDEHRPRTGLVDVDGVEERASGAGGDARGLRSVGANHCEHHGGAAGCEGGVGDLGRDDLADACP